ncbi:DUF1624 domain-containing protein [Alsobacter sp. SYSU M60028]|uniref:DUF1624 domain-containing protein n=1 Tax=Alsobacter ponti TaxID=2962936 RepID=A0ABT1LBV3_9HYPH|nr:heparan-alpha-glucosaminide N-acetyltransferase [Alsobacter ponti]MCP8938944.1 DUF1624 domain-containing protein [Alsobacter ponti]
MSAPQPTLPPPPAAAPGVPLFPAATPRIPAIDVARGVAIVAMVIYHFTWDLGFFGVIGLKAGIDPAWRLFAKLIAGSFLALVGVGLVLAHRDGVRRGPFLTRLAFVAGGALLVSLSTWMMDADSFVFFGILHCIAVSSVLALPFVRAPVWLTAAVAAIVLALPAFVFSTTLDGPAWWWLGLSASLPRTNDFEPIFPWFGVVLGGVALARLALAAGLDAALARWAAADPVSRGLRWAGRHSLVIYLVHQPALFGLLSLAVAVGLPVRATAPAPGARVDRFVEACIAECRGAGADAAYCAAGCQCIANELAGTDIPGRSLAGRASDADRLRIRDAALMCKGQEMDDSPAESAPAPEPAK